MKKGQMEIIGLVVIVILISLGMLFMAVFALSSDSSKKTFTRKGLASSTVSGILKLNVGAECPGQGSPQLGGDILEDCAIYFGYKEDSASSIYQCREKHSCDFFREISNEILNGTLGEQEKKYEFTVHLIEQKGATPKDLIEIIKNKGGCPKATISNQDSSKPFPLQTDAGLVEVELKICD
ncbi:hypothetical protein HQ489_01765 [Candidatus Woesearchaeota archaeon]|nr:hypothetical protein [Candidatus Woesearchaeota archaeon]